MLHQFPAVYIDLDVEREPCLYLYKHEAEFLIQVIEVIMQTFGAGGLQEVLLLAAADHFSGPAGFQCLQDADKATVYGIRKEEILSDIFFPVFCGRKIYNLKSVQ